MSGPGAPVIQGDGIRKFGEGDLERFDEPQLYDRYIPKQKEVDTFRRVENLAGVPLTQHGEDSKGRKYQQYFDYGPGGQELMYLAGGLRKDLRRIPGTQTLDGAKAWIQRTGKKNWRALEHDFTGPDMKPDGLDEVVITDGKGRVKVVNGYALKTSDYPWRKMYYKAYPDKEEQRKNPFSEFKYLGMMPSIEPNSKGEYEYEMELAPGMRPNITPRTQYRKLIFTPSYKLFKGFTDTINWSAMDKARLSTTVFTACYETIIVKPAVGKKANIPELKMRELKEKQYKKLLGKEVVKDAVRAELNEYLESSDGAAELLLKTVWMIVHTLEETLNVEIPKTGNVYGVPLATLMRFNNVHQIDAGLADGRLIRPVIAEWQTHNSTMKDQMHQGYLTKLAERNTRRDQRNALHQNFIDSGINLSNARARRDAMYGDYYGLERGEPWNAYYRPRE